MEKFLMTEEELRQYVRKHMESVGLETLALLEAFRQISDLCAAMKFSLDETHQAFTEFEDSRKVVLHVPVIIPISSYLLPYMNVCANKTIPPEEKTTHLSQLHLHLFRDLAELLDNEITTRIRIWEQEAEDQLIKEGVLCHMTKKADG